MLGVIGKTPEQLRDRIRLLETEIDSFKAKQDELVKRIEIIEERPATKSWGAKSIAEVADFLGCSVRTVKYLQCRDPWPQNCGQPGAWHLPAIARWLEESSKRRKPRKARRWFFWNWFIRSY